MELQFTWIGIASLIVFILGYYVIAAEDKYHINKTKPAIFIGTFMFMLIGAYMSINGLPKHELEHEVRTLIEEIAEIVFFLMVAMTYIEALIERNVFNALKYKLVTRNYTYRQLFWLTGLLAFFLSPVADNLTTALILSTVLLTIDRTERNFLIPGAINIVVAANAGGAWSPFGDITTLMVWTSGKAGVLPILALFPASFIGWLATAFILSRYVPNVVPHFDAATMKVERIKAGGKVIIGLAIFTIACAVAVHGLFELPAVWGMMFGLSLLSLYIYFFNRRHGNQDINVFEYMTKIEMDTLLFFFGILAAVGALHVVGWLSYAAQLYETVGVVPTNIGVGLLSAIVDNVPVMSAVLKANPTMDLSDWCLVTLTAGIGGSLISFGSAAGVGVMGKMRGIYTFASHMKYSWTIMIGYIISIVIWYLQYTVLSIY